MAIRNYIGMALLNYYCYRMYYFFIVLGITLHILLKEVAVCQPYITGPTPVICPDGNETFVFTCRDSQVFYITWSVDPAYGIFSEIDRMQFAAIDDNRIGKPDRRPPFTGMIIGIFNISNTPSNQPVADLVSTLTVFNKNISDRTVVTCTTLQRNNSKSRSQITFIIAEKPHPTTTLLMGESATFKSSYSSVQLIQFFATLFNGTAIDYYNISLSGGQETYSIVNTSENLSTPTWIHNVTKLNVTAHNCAGQSDPVTINISHGCDQPLPPMNGSVDNVTTELGGRITFRCNDGFQPSEVMTAVCQTTGWSQDTALLECFPQVLELNSSRQDTGIAIGVIAISVTVGTAALFIITFMVVASICLYVGRAKRKCLKSIPITENTRSTSGDSERPDAQPESSSVMPSYPCAQVQVSLERMDLTNNPAYEVCQQRTNLSQSGIDLTNNPAYEVCQQRTNLSQSGIDLTNNPAYEVCQQKTDMFHMRSLSAQEPEYNMDNNPLYMMVNSQK